MHLWNQLYYHADCRFFHTSIVLWASETHSSYQINEYNCQSFICRNTFSHKSIPFHLVRYHNFQKFIVALFIYAEILLEVFHISFFFSLFSFPNILMSPVVQTKSLTHLLPLSFLFSDWANKT